MYLSDTSLVERGQLLSLCNTQIMVGGERFVLYITNMEDQTLGAFFFSSLWQNISVMFWCNSEID